MRLIGFNFNKIGIERFKDKTESIKFNTKIDLLSIDTLKSDFIRTKEEIIQIDFGYSIIYEPDYAKIELGGKILLSVEPKKAKEILKEWKNKKMSDEFRVFVFNIILRKSNIKALQLEDELGLPPHFRLPSLTKEKMEEKKKNS